MLKLMALIVVTFLYGTAVAQELVIYPAKGQSNEQTEKDKFECYSWAKGQTGFDPMVTPQATTPPPAQQTKSVAGGAAVGGVGGAALGAGIGAIAGGSSGAGKGAAIGALVGWHHRRCQKPFAKPTDRAGAKAVGTGAGGSIPAEAK